jgi:signal peptidase I
MTTKAANDSIEAKRVAKHSAKETIISIVIAFALAFVFRGFVVEAYVIPTGSMAPTLMGQHMRFTGDTGYQWPMGPAEYYNNNAQTPAPLQGTRENPLVVRDPMTGPSRESRYERTRGSTSPSPRAMYDRQVAQAPIRGGDRIFVMKYLYSIYDPSRFDVVVFKNPRSPTENYIKRLVGLPGEQIALVDGDVFRRSAPDGYPVGPGDLPPGAQSPWTEDGWQIARKDGRVEDTLWQLVHDSSYTPLDVVRDGKRWNAPWLPNAMRINAKDWDLLGESNPRGVYSYTGTGPTSLVWDAATWPITDSYPYNDQSRARAGGRPRPNGEYPVADLAIRMTVKPAKADAVLSATVTSLGHEFKGEVRGTAARVLMRELRADPNITMTPDEGWQVLNESTLSGPLSTEQFTRFEFRHVDQSLELRIENERVAYGEYDWSPAERLRHATGKTVEQVLTDGDLSVLATSQNYSGVGVRIEMDSGATQLANVAVMRDVFYRPDMHPMGRRAGLPGSGTHPRYTLTLGPEQFFVCGDNSPDSLDGRLWGDPDPWTASIDPSPSIVPRRLMIGKAFFVYFPAPGRTPVLNIPMPDFGRLRWIF